MVPQHFGQMRGSIVGISIEAVLADHNLFHVFLLFVIKAKRF